LYSGSSMNRSLLNAAVVGALVATLATPPARLWAADKPDDKANSPSKTKEEGKQEQPGVTRFYGVVTAVDTKAMTFTVDKETYHVIGESQVTKANGETTTLNESLVGQPARGSYTKAADGTLNVTKVRFGKKTGGKAGGGKKKDAADSGESKDDKTSKDSKDAPAAPSGK
jgi:hypothetical protein